MESKPVYYRWKEIEGLPEDLGHFRDPELDSMLKVWNAEKKRIGNDRSVAEFSVQLKREWAIETGIIEGVYTLDRGITQTLIERGIDASYISHSDTNRDPTLVARIIQTHIQVLDGLFSFVRGERELNVGYIKELHAALMSNADAFTVVDQFGTVFEKSLQKGDYKTMPNNPTRSDGTIHEYCPPEHVPAEMDRLIRLHHEHTNRGVPTHVEAAWLHHAFTQIHPFEDGNGRVARAIATLVFIKRGFFPLVINRDLRARYIDALETADDGDLLEIVRLFSQVQKRAFTKAVGMAYDVMPVKSLEAALVATKDMVTSLMGTVPDEFVATKQLAQSLADEAIAKLNHVASVLAIDIGQQNASFQFFGGHRSITPSNHVYSMAKSLQYEPNFRDFDETAVLGLINHEDQSTIVFSFHGVGAAFRGVIATSGYFIQRDDDAPVALSEDIFRISYEDAKVEITPRFHKWLDDCLIKGLALWRKTLV